MGEKEMFLLFVLSLFLITFSLSSQSSDLQASSDYGCCTTVAFDQN